MPPVSFRSPPAATAPASLQAPADAGQGVDTNDRLTPREKLEVLRDESAAKKGYGARRVDSLVTVDLEIPLMNVRPGNRVMAFVQVRIHSTQPLPHAPNEVFAALACDRAAERLRAALRSGGK